MTKTLATLPPNHEIRLVARQVPILAAQSVSRDETALAFSQKVVQLLYKTDSDLGREIFVILLERLCEVSVKVAKEVTAWLVYAEDERKFNVAVTVGLVRAGLINIVEQDVQLAKFVVKEFKPTVVDFASQFALACLGEPACATKSQLSNTIDALTRAAQRGKATDSASQFLSELEGGQLKSKTDIGNSALREQLAYCFAEWVRLFSTLPCREVLHRFRYAAARSGRAEPANDVPAVAIGRRQHPQYAPALVLPRFTFSWMTLISHRLFMPKLLASGLIGGLWEEGRSEGWAAYHRLFGSLLRFLMPFLRTAELRETSRNLYMGTLRILLVLLHDFPEFLSSFHASLCDLVPTSCIQLRNLILSSYPREQFGVAGLPDAFTPRLKIEELPHGDESPIILSDFTGVIAQQPGDFNAALDAYLAEGGPSSFLSTLQDTVVTQGEYNTPLLNAIVLYSGVKSMEQQGRTSDAGFQVIEELLTSLDPEGRYLTVGAVCNQLRVPSKHTAYYSSMILNLFEQHEEVREAILRVLVERVIVNRPHPWGLLVTMFALLRNEEGRYPLPPNCPLDIVELLQHMREGLPGGNRGASASAEGTYQQQWLQQQEQAQPPHHQFDQHLHHQHHQQQQQSQQQQLSA
ncbi:hypothetical protein L7F22_031493 [Adiantum nelumboides]|nr:hypothetical protein [Adiantum nelumboides]